MIERIHRLSVTKLAKVRISRRSAYIGRALDQRRIDQPRCDYPFAGTRLLQGLLLGEGIKV
jgi:putative transposase